MMNNDEGNPILIFEAEHGSDHGDISHVPLVLVHDGGGTCFPYHCLDPLGRPTYAISNSRWHSQQPWAGGIPEMARHYVSLIHKTVPRGRILLGGWSLGGLLSLAMARVLADEPHYTVVGIVMVDTMCPGSVSSADWQRRPREIAFHGQFSPMTSKDTKERVRWCFAEAIQAISAWQMPRWDEDRTSPAHGMANLAVERPRRLLPAPQCPPAILLRAMHAVPTDSQLPNRVDMIRSDRALGWNSYRAGFFDDIVDVPGHHFNMFAFDHIDAISHALVQACSKLEARHRRGPAPAERSSQQIPAFRRTASPGYKLYPRLLADATTVHGVKTGA